MEFCGCEIGRNRPERREVGVGIDFGQALIDMSEAGLQEVGDPDRLSGDLLGLYKETFGSNAGYGDLHGGAGLQIHRVRRRQMKRQ